MIPLVMMLVGVVIVVGGISWCLRYDRFVLAILCLIVGLFIIVLGGSIGMEGDREKCESSGGSYYSEVVGWVSISASLLTAFSLLSTLTDAVRLTM